MREDTLAIVAAVVHSVSASADDYWGFVDDASVHTDGITEATASTQLSTVNDAMQEIKSLVGPRLEDVDPEAVGRWVKVSVKASIRQIGFCIEENGNKLLSVSCIGLHTEVTAAP